MSEYEGIFIAFASTSDSEKERLELEFIVFFGLYIRLLFYF